MKANPGGQIPPNQVIGRDEFIAQLWSALESQSVVLTAERRMGKTCVIKKMRAEAPAERIPVYRDLESVHSALEFAEVVLHDVSAHLATSQKLALRAREFLAKLGGVEIGGVVKLPEVAAAHWKTILTHSIEDLVEHQHRALIFFWDELPFMLDNIKRRTSENEAMEVLDTLRALRQTHPQLRMVFTGSIGLHHVISSLKDAGYANAPTNDMLPLELLPLEAEHAQSLARQLLEGEGIAMNDARAVAATIAAAVDNVPFYIHHVVSRLKRSGGSATIDVANKAVAALLTEAQDPWELRHFRTRINQYYGEARRTAVLTILDFLAVAENPLPISELLNSLKSQLGAVDRESMLQLLTLLQRDHYTARNEEGAYFFRFPLIKRWWRIDRGL